MGKVIKLTQNGYDNTLNLSDEKARIRRSLIFPIFFVSLIWIVKIVEWGTLDDFSQYGIWPLHLIGLRGIVLSPFIHADFEHLISNTLPLLFLSSAIFYFYFRVAYRVFFFIYLVVGLWVWFIGRDAIHMGASGLVYGCFAFLFFGGIFSSNRQLLSISLLVVFLYGGLVWGVFPGKEHISWESHLMGFLAGMFFAYYYRNEIPKEKTMTQDDDDEDDTSDYQSTKEDHDYSVVHSTADSKNINYSFKES